MNDPQDDLVPVEIACEILGGRASPLHPATLYRGIRDGRYPKPLKMGPQMNRWRRSELVAKVDEAARARTAREVA
jgi:predicted DNA-binding transcriptional regulator AlpA